jgi:nucleotidyltransferase substrate binding protein (TIGR01987 family)
MININTKNVVPQELEQTMPMTPRWKKRYVNFLSVLNRLQKYVEKEELTELEEPGFIQTFEFVCELAWNTIKDFYEDQGGDMQQIQGGKDAVRLAFQRGLIREGKAWLRLIGDRNLTSHTYHEILAKQVADNIRNEYYGLFQELAETLKKPFEQSEELSDDRT